MQHPQHRRPFRLQPEVRVHAGQVVHEFDAIGEIGKGGGPEDDLEHSPGSLHVRGGRSIVEPVLDLLVVGPRGGQVRMDGGDVGQGLLVDGGGRAQLAEQHAELDVERGQGTDVCPDLGLQAGQAGLGGGQIRLRVGDGRRSEGEDHREGDQHPAHASRGGPRPPSGPHSGA